MKNIFFTVLFVIAGIFSLSAQTFEEVKAKAEQGDADAQYELSWQYVGLDDMENALLWLQKSAESGRLETYSEIATFYASTADIESMLLWLHKGADAGDPKSCIALGDIYSGAFSDNIPYELPKDCDKAKYYIHKGLSCENIDAEMLLMAGLCFYSPVKENNQDCLYDVDEAIKVFSKVAHEPDNDAMDKAKALLFLGSICFDNADYDGAAEQFAMSDTYGDFVSANDEVAAVYFKRGTMYEQGLGVPKDMDKAIEFYNTAASSNKEVTDADDEIDIQSSEVFQYR